MDALMVTLPTGPDGKHSVDINVDEIAALRSHTVVSYSYEEWTEVHLKSGTVFNCRVKKQDLADEIAKKRRARL